MSDRHFDELATRFAEKIYGGAKGAIRLAVLQADLKEALPERPLPPLNPPMDIATMEAPPVAMVTEPPQMVRSSSRSAAQPDIFFGN